jgi:DNA-binding PadR family transcriptional regulator
MTNSELVLLSLIAKHPRHGYELEQVIEERGMRNWSEIAFSSIYFLLKRLVLEGMATSLDTEPAQGRCPSKKVYAATPAGMANLRRGVHDSLANPEPGSRAFMFGLSCLPFLNRQETIAALHERQGPLLARVHELEQYPELTQPGFPFHVKTMFTYSLPLLQAELDWLKNFIFKVSKGDLINGKD